MPKKTNGYKTYGWLRRDQLGGRVWLVCCSVVVCGDGSNFWAIANCSGIQINCLPAVLIADSKLSSVAALWFPHFLRARGNKDQSV